MSAAKDRPLPDPKVYALQGDIERTRSELGETIDELTAKFDLPARARHAAQDATVKMRRTIGRHEFLIGGAILAGLSVMVVLLVTGKTPLHRHD